MKIIDSNSNCSYGSNNNDTNEQKKNLFLKECKPLFNQINPTTNSTF